LYREVYEGHDFLRTLGALTSLVAFAAAFWLIPVLGLWALAVAIPAKVLTYTHLFPIAYLVIFRPLVRLVRRILNLIRIILTKIGPQLRRLWCFVRPYVKRAWTWCWDKVVRLVRFLWPYAVRLGDWIWDKVVRLVNALWPSFVKALEWLYRQAKAVWHRLNNVIDKLWALAVKLVKPVYNFLAQAFTTVMQKLNTAIGALLARLGGRLALLKQQVSAWVESLWQSLAAMANSVSLWATEIWASLASALDRLTGSGKG
ncbi:MAG: hypothetical protein JSS86_13280, partial [Cyanobacteria bacterium SZAS LIN-2]|nr:hypothetical protein [Cyanobacteria bacterium SZAS LIN-2]